MEREVGGDRLGTLIAKEDYPGFLQREAVSWSPGFRHLWQATATAEVLGIFSETGRVSGK